MITTVKQQTGEDGYTVRDHNVHVGEFAQQKGVTDGTEGNSGTGFNDPGTEHSPQSSSHALNRLSAKVKETSFRVNDLYNKFNRHDGEIQELRSVLASPTLDVIGQGRGQGQDQGQSQGQAKANPGRNPNAIEFWPRTSPLCVSGGSACTSPLLGFSPSPERGRSPRATGGQETAHMAYLFSEARRMPYTKMLRRASTEEGTGSEGLSQDTDPGRGSCSEAESGLWEWDRHSPCDIDLHGNTVLSEEVSNLRNRVTALEKELLEKEARIRELSASREQDTSADVTSQQKQEWYEHKMRLLKQDKRRRGETIGKLLRCLDDMRDTGKLEPGRVSEGRMVLSASLQSRGWPQEQRIKAAVAAMELERAEQRRLAQEAAAEAAKAAPEDAGSTEGQTQQTDQTGLTSEGAGKPAEEAV